jgi:hypothetical protein
MVEGDADWRLMGQEAYLLGVELVRKPYRAPSDTWEHDHCSFCWAKFMDPAHSAEHAAAVAEDPDLLIEGYTTTDTHPMGAGYYWVCPACFDDFHERFCWHVADDPA